jgi:hypothetical protein
MASSTCGDFEQLAAVTDDLRGGTLRRGDLSAGSAIGQPDSHPPDL